MEDTNENESRDPEFKILRISSAIGSGLIAEDFFPSS